MPYAEFRELEPPVVARFTILTYYDGHEVTRVGQELCLTDDVATVQFALTFADGSEFLGPVFRLWVKDRRPR